MSAYAKSLVPLVVGILVGVVLLVIGEHKQGIAVLLATVTLSGISYGVPNRDPVTGRRHR